MTDYRKLSKFHQNRVMNKILDEIEPGSRKNENNGFEWTEPTFTINMVAAGYYCAECFSIYYNCTCDQ